MIGVLCLRDNFFLSRYGNPAYRDWFASLENEGEQLLAEVVAGTGKEG